VNLDWLIAPLALILDLFSERHFYTSDDCAVTQTSAKALAKKLEALMQTSENYPLASDVPAP